MRRTRSCRPHRRPAHAASDRPAFSVRIVSPRSSRKPVGSAAPGSGAVSQPLIEKDAIRVSPISRSATNRASSTWGPCAGPPSPSPFAITAPCRIESAAAPASWNTGRRARTWSQQTSSDCRGSAASATARAPSSTPAPRRTGFQGGGGPNGRVLSRPIGRSRFPAPAPWRASGSASRHAPRFRGRNPPPRGGPACRNGCAGPGLGSEHGHGRTTASPARHSGISPASQSWRRRITRRDLDARSPPSGPVAAPPKYFRSPSGRTTSSPSIATPGAGITPSTSRWSQGAAPSATGVTSGHRCRRNKPALRPRHEELPATHAHRHLLWNCRRGPRSVPPPRPGLRGPRRGKAPLSVAYGPSRTSASAPRIGAAESTSCAGSPSAQSIAPAKSLRVTQSTPRGESPPDCAGSPSPAHMRRSGLW